MSNEQKLPITVTRSVELLGLCLIGALIYLGQQIIMPILTSFFIAILLMPIHRKLMKRKVPEVLSIVICITLALLIITAILTFIGWQIANLAKDYPELYQNIKGHWQTLSAYIEQKTSWSKNKQLIWFNTQFQNLMKNGGSMFASFAVSASSVLAFVALMPIYVFLILFYKNLLMRFVFFWFSREAHDKVEHTMIETQVIIKSYLVGLMIQITYITIGLGGILFLFGIPHAFLIGIIFGILNLIPYIGALVGNILGVLITLSSSPHLWHIFLVLGVIALIQFIDNNIIMPKVVGEKVQINAFVTIIGLLIGSALAGVSGMFLSLPVMAILKIVFDQTEEFKHWGMLLGADRPKLSPLTNNALRLSRKDIQEQLIENNNTVNDVNGHQNNS